MKKLLAIIVSVLAIGSVSATDITGAGATFPYPLYAKWADSYKKETGVGLNYQSIGSGGGIKQIKSKTVDFGASDMPLTPEELDANGLMQFPAIIGGVVPIVNLDGIKNGDLRLTGIILADIYLGKIKNWNDPAIVALNPNAKLSETPITVVRRADGSGTTFIFTNYLSKVDSEWKTKVGEGTAVSWATGIGGKGNEGVAAYVQRIKGSIGYVEYAYAKRNGLTCVQLKNRAGNWVSANEESFKAAAANVHWDKVPAFYELLTDQPGEKSWSISGASFIIIYKKSTEPRKTLGVLTFFDWAFKHGGKMASELEYVSLPDSLVQFIEQTWRQQVKDNNDNSGWK